MAAKTGTRVRLGGTILMKLDSGVRRNDEGDRTYYLGAGRI